LKLKNSDLYILVTYKGHHVGCREGIGGELEVLLHPYTTFALEVGLWSAPRPGRFNPEKRPGWVGPMVGLDGYGKFLPPLGFGPRTVSP